MYYVLTWVGLLPSVVMWYGESREEGLRMLERYGKNHILVKVEEVR